MLARCETILEAASTVSSLCFATTGVATASVPQPVTGAIASSVECVVTVALLIRTAGAAVADPGPVAQGRPFSEAIMGVVATRITAGLAAVFIGTCRRVLAELGAPGRRGLRINTPAGRVRVELAASHRGSLHDRTREGSNSVPPSQTTMPQPGGFNLGVPRAMILAANSDAYVPVLHYGAGSLNLAAATVWEQHPITRMCKESSLLFARRGQLTHGPFMLCARSS